MHHSIWAMLTSYFILVPVICLPLGSESTITEQGRAAELKIVSVEHHEPQKRLVALNKKQSLPSEDPTTKVPSMYIIFLA